MHSSTRKLALAVLRRLASRLGYVVLTNETAAALTIFKTRAEDAEAALAAEHAATRNRELRDGTALIKHLGQLAGVELPKAVEHASALFDELREQRTRTARVEAEATCLAAALIEEEFPETTD